MLQIKKETSNIWEHEMLAETMDVFIERGLQVPTTAWFDILQIL